MFKRIITASAALALTFGAACYLPEGTTANIGIAAQAEGIEILTYGDFKYILLDDGSAEIIGYTGSDQELTVPAALGKIKVKGFNGLTMLGAPDSEIKRIEKIKKVTFADGIEYLGQLAFYSNTAIEEVVMPDSITALGHSDEHGDYNLFNGCTALKKVTLSNGLTKLPMNTFAGCTSLESITLPDSITVLNQWAFRDCTKLKEIKLSSKLESIGWECFLGCSELKSIIIPKTVKSISVDAYGVNMDENGEYSKYDNTVIYGYSKTAAEDYANKNGIKFIAIASVKNAAVTLSKTSYTYSGKAKKPAVTVKLGKTTLKKGTDYTVTYKNNTKVGKATVTINGIGAYEGKISKAFKINPKSTTVKKVTSPKKKQLKVTYKKIAGVTGYQVTYSTSKKFAASKTKTAAVKGAAKTSKTIKSLRSGKTYYIKIRAYKTVSGKKYYSAYTKAKKIKIK
ncbi:MAG: leucine-rich repeat protein [Ruminococcus sp.]|nr:leucine-rich repeat protein [Ruminococcus sp.]